jgi:hypothetical protein
MQNIRELHGAWMYMVPRRRGTRKGRANGEIAHGELWMGGVRLLADPSVCAIRHVAVRPIGAANPLLIGRCKFFELTI